MAKMQRKEGNAGEDKRFWTAAAAAETGNRAEGTCEPAKRAESAQNAPKPERGSWGLLKGVGGRVGPTAGWAAAGGEESSCTPDDEPLITRVLKKKKQNILTNKWCQLEVSCSPCLYFYLLTFYFPENWSLQQRWTTVAPLTQESLD